MAKEAYYFSHDANARTDPKIMDMIMDYKAEGYGLYWCVIEMLREQDEYKLKLNKATFNAIAMHMQCERNATKLFVEKCICDYELFASDGDYFWSESLIKRMKVKEKKSEMAKKSAEARWKNRDRDNSDNGATSGDSDDKNDDSDGNANLCDGNANALQPHSECTENGCDGNANKGKEKKGKEIKLNSNKYMSDSNEYRLALYLFNYIKTNNPSAKEPNLNTWAKQFDYMLRIDKRPLEDVKAVITFSQKDSFWLTNILSPTKLREKYDQLMVRMKNPIKPQNKTSTFNGFEQRTDTDPDYNDRVEKIKIAQAEKDAAKAKEDLKDIEKENVSAGLKNLAKIINSN